MWNSLTVAARPSSSTEVVWRSMAQHRLDLAVRVLAHFFAALGEREVLAAALHDLMTCMGRCSGVGSWMALVELDGRGSRFLGNRNGDRGRHRRDSSSEGPVHRCSIRPGDTL